MDRRTLSAAVRNHTCIPAIVLLGVLSVVCVSAQDTVVKKDIPEIATEAGKATVLVVVYDESGKQIAVGSGFVISGDGRVVTNYHVIEGAASAMVKFSDGAFFLVEGLSASNPEKDLAILGLRASDREFKYLPLADFDHVRVGDSVVAIGSPLTLEGTVSTGIISAIRQSESRKFTLLQTTAPISPGSSGGPLLNMKAEVIGVTTSSWSGGQNVNFAIPTSYVNPLIHDAAPVTPFPALVREEGEPGALVDFAGTYTGIWQSGRFAVSGAAAMKVIVQGESITAEIFLTGGEISRDTLIGTVTSFGDGVLAVEFKAKRSKLTAKGIFREGTFVGDYYYRRRMAPDDRGQWLLKRK